jgi:hypothetical protein
VTSGKRPKGAGSRAPLSAASKPLASVRLIVKPGSADAAFASAAFVSANAADPTTGFALLYSLV